MQLDSRIGVLNSGKFYAFANGYDQPEIVGNLEEVEVALGLRVLPNMGAKKKRSVRSFSVTVTPSMLTYAGTMVLGEYVVELNASTHKEAISKARLQRRDEDGTQAVPATFRARLSH